ncbi:MAG: hypothetical protein JW720_09045, partial [Sedimentisphaerales bacterium]|nr:hypothetical protein [Sedimentisphaerales bacterium]
MKKLRSVILATVVIGAVSVALAGSVGSGFTYQGRLLKSGGVADGEFDFRFELYDDPCTVDSNQIGGTIDVNALDVIDGYFTIELNFGPDVFDGNDRWLQIRVRPADSNDLEGFVGLSPRQRMTVTPYALYALNGNQGPQGIQGEQGPQGEPG